MAKRIVVLVLIAAALAAALLYSQRRHHPLRVSGFVEADEIRVGSRVGGRVSAVHVGEGRQVRTGDTLIELAPYDLLERQAEAQANLAASRAHLEQLVAGPRPQEIEAARARRQRAQAMVNLAKLTFDRVRGTFERGAATRDERDTAEQELIAATAQLEEHRQIVAELEAGTRPEEIAQARAAVDAADATLRSVQRQVEELVIVSPVDGQVEALELQPGDLVPANAPVLSLMDTRALWVRAYVPENELDLEIGRKVQVSVDSFPGRRFAAHISFIARQAEFTPGNVQTPEDRAKQVFRIKATLDEGLDLLRPGMSADVWLEALEGTAAVPSTAPATQP